MKIVILTFLLWVLNIGATLARPAPAPSCLDVSVERAKEVMGQSAAVARVRNACDESFQVVHLKCTWLAGDDELGTGEAEVLDLAPDQTGGTQAINWSQPEGFDEVRCEAIAAVPSGG